MAQGCGWDVTVSTHQGVYLRTGTVGIKGAEEPSNATSKAHGGVQLPQ